jgi:hypothetical protein
MRVFKFLWFVARVMLREAIEPILLTSGLAILFSRVQCASLEVYENTGAQNISDIYWSIRADMESDPMIYWILVVIFISWIAYKAYKVRKEEKRDALMKENTEALKKLVQSFEDFKKEMRGSKKD